MSYDFSKLSRVPENNVLTDNTYSLIVNNDEVEKTHYESLINNIQDYSADCTEWMSSQTGAPTPVDYIRSLSPIQVESGYAPRTGYINYQDYFYLFTIMIDVNITWYEIKEIDTNLNTCTEYLYDQSDLVEKIIKDGENGTDYKTPIVFSNITSLTVNGDTVIDGKLNVTDDAEFGNNVVFRSNIYAENPTIIDNSRLELNGSLSYINFNGDSAEVNLKEEDGNLKVFTDNDNPARIVNVANPIGNYDVANKQFVEAQDNVLRNDLLARINNRLSAASSTGEICKIVKVWFEWDEYRQEFRWADDENGTGSVSMAQTTMFAYDATPANGSSKIEFLTAYYQLYNDTTYYYDTLDLSYGPINNTTYRMFAEIDHESGNFAGGIVKFLFVYLLSSTDITVPELTALRTPYNYSGTINSYDSSVNYSIGDYCYYPSSVTGRLYKCTTATTGTWDSNDWMEVYARDSIESAFNELFSSSGGGGGGGSVTDSNAVHYTVDTGKSSAEKAIALANINGEPKKMVVNITEASNVYSIDTTYSVIESAILAGKTVECLYDDTNILHLDYFEEGSVVTFFSKEINIDGQLKIYTFSIYNDDSCDMVENVYVKKPGVVKELLNANITISLAKDNTIYEYGELTSLTITDIPLTGDFIIRFRSGPTPTVTNFPAAMVFPEAFAAAANTRYEINVSNKYALAVGWS